MRPDIVNRVGGVCTYRINHKDEIVEVGRNWDWFAKNNHATDKCFAPRLIGTILWDHIHDAETQHLYDLLTTKVRRSRNPITLPLRCDSPALKRYLEITITPEADGFVAFESKTVRTEPRPPMAFLDAGHPRSRELIRICSFCKQVDMGDDRWIETEMAITHRKLFSRPLLPQLTHATCPTCYERVMKKAR